VHSHDDDNNLTPRNRGRSKLRRLRRDAHEAAALAEELADLVLRIEDDHA
jgi:hypothetical protein